MLDLISRAMAAPTSSPALQKLQELQLEAKQLQTPQTGAPIQAASTSWWSVTDAMTISAVVLGFGAITIFVAARLIRHERDSQVILRVLATMLIITLAVFLIVAGYSDQQIAPAMGLLGTIAGYLLGKETRQPPDKTTP